MGRAMSDKTSKSNGGMNGSAARFLAGYPDAALLVGRDSTVLATNTKGITLETLLRHGGAPEVPALVLRAVQEGTITAGTVALRGTRGSVVLDVSVVPEVFDGHLAVLVRDMTLERNLRAALVASRERYKDLAEVANDFVWEVGADGTFSFVSPSGTLGFRSADLMGHRPEEIVVNADAYSPLPFLSEHPLRDVELSLRRADGGEARVVVACRPILSESNEWAGNRGVWREIASGSTQN